MSFLTDIKRRLFLRSLDRRRQASRPPAAAGNPLNLRSATRIVLLYPADSAEDRKAVDKWRDAHKTTNNRIESLGYFSTDVGAANFDLVAVTPKSLNWYGAPGGPEVEEFLKGSCDLLLRLGPADHPELDYLATLKPASLKIGPRSSASDNPYHLQFDTHGNDRPGAALTAIERIFSFTNAATT